jgi:hypothetical protein
MKLAQHCVVCGSHNITKKLGLFAPFMASRLFELPLLKVNDGTGDRFLDVFTNAIWCNDCGAVFSQMRPDPDELARVYEDYRGPEYNRVRSFFEPGYERWAGIMNSDMEWINRQSLSCSFLQDSIDPSQISRILDYGGDKGQFIPKIFTSGEKFVYDISGVGVVDGVRIVNDLAEVGKVDFAMASNVLEHVSYPQEIMADIVSTCRPGTYVFIDVPQEDPAKTWVVDFHEHINFFTPHSVHRLIEQAGLKVLKMAIAETDHGVGPKGKSIFALARMD